MGDIDPLTGAAGATPPASGARYQLHDGLPSRRLVSEVIVFDPRADVVHELAGAGADIFGALAAATTPMSCEEVLEVLGHPDGGDVAAVGAFLDQLVGRSVAFRVQ